MKDIKYNPTEEKSLNDKLVNLYGPKIPSLYAAVKPLFDDPDAKKPALPLLIELYEDDNEEYPYEKADLRVMVFGRENNNWNDEKNRASDTYTDFKYNFNLKSSEDIKAEISGVPDKIHGIGDIYGDYCYHDTSYKKTKFTIKKDELITILKNRLPELKIVDVWNNIFKIGLSLSKRGNSCSQPTPKIQEIEREYFNVIADEVKILKPDVILFLTGKGVDGRIREVFGLSDDAFNPVKDGLFLDRIEIPGVKYAARTVHPSERFKPNEYFTRHFNALVNDLIGVIKCRN